MAYRINGNELEVPDGGNVTFEEGTAPTSHSVVPSQPAIVDTIGGKIAIEPPSGRVNVHTWQYDMRSSAAFGLIRGYIGSNPLCVIDTYDQNGAQLTDIVCIAQIAEIKSANRRDRVDSFSITFTEVSPQS